MKKVVPYDENSGKKLQVEQMFDNIAGKYDLLNDLLSFGIENRWKKKLVRYVSRFNPQNILDVATGTGDLILYLNKLHPRRIVGIDISEQMLAIARNKIKRKLGTDSHVEFYQQDGENLECRDEAFDLVTCAFGVRNFENLEKGLIQMHRVLKKGGILAILEFSQSQAPVFSRIFNFYFEKFLPYLGGVIAKDYKAYKYLPESVKEFPSGQDFVNIVNAQGFETIKVLPLTFGIATIYVFRK